MTFEELKAEVLKLPAEKRAELIRSLHISLDANQKPDTEVQQAWIEEAERRHQDYLEGKNGANSRRRSFPQSPCLPAMRGFVLDPLAEEI